MNDQVSSCIGAVDRFVRRGIHPGAACEAILKNDLQEAIGRFSEDDIGDLLQIVRHVYNNVPGLCRRAEFEVWLGTSQERRDEVCSLATYYASRPEVTP